MRMQVSAFIRDTSENRSSVVRRVVEGLSAASDETRLRILGLLVAGGPLCVCELAESLRLPHYNISRHLNILKRGGFLESRRERRYVFYSVAKSPAAALLQPVLRQLAHASGHDAVLGADVARLRDVIQVRDGQARLTAYCEAVDPVGDAMVSDNSRPASSRRSGQARLRRK